METKQLFTYALFFSLGLIIMYIILRSSKKDKTAVKPSTMRSATIKNMISNYRSKQLAVINNNLGVNDAQSVWFNLSIIKNFISSIETESRKINSDISEKDLGIRFYYAAYPNEQNWNSTDLASIRKDYAEKHTLIMIPTLNKKNEDGELIGYDFNPLDRATYSLDRNKEQQHEMKMMAMSSVSDTSDVMGQNHGQLIPPAKITGQGY